MDYHTQDTFEGNYAKNNEKEANFGVALFQASIASLIVFGVLYIYFIVFPN